MFMIISVIKSMDVLSYLFDLTNQLVMLKDR